MEWETLFNQNTFFAIVGVLFIGMIYFENCYSYWKKRKVPCLPAIIPFGNMKTFITFQKSVGENLNSLYFKLKTYEKPVGGFFILTKPTLLVLDPDLTKRIIQTDFEHFIDRAVFKFDDNSNPLFLNIFHTRGEKWRELRTKLTPAFTSGKMKFMFSTLVACAKQLEEILEQHVETKTAFEVQDMMSRFATDIVSSIGFGHDINSLKDPNNEFKLHGDMIAKKTRSEVIARITSFCFPNFMTTFRIKIITDKLQNFFMDLVKDTVQYREKNNVKRKDFLDILMNLQSEILSEKGENSSLTIKQMAAQCFMFFTAGFETSSSSFSSMVYHLAMNQEIQDKTRDEIHTILEKHNGELTYDALQDMTYTQKVIDETLRINPAIPILARECNKDYKIPNSDLTIEKGTSVFIPLRAYQHDPEYYPNPEVFDPERFSTEEKNKRHPYVYLPFGSGPRHCIGLRFAIMQLKVGLVALLNKYRYTLNDKTKRPLKEHPLNNVYSYVGGVWVDVNKVND